MKLQGRPLRSWCTQQVSGRPGLASFLVSYDFHLGRDSWVFLPPSLDYQRSASQLSNSQSWGSSCHHHLPQHCGLVLIRQLVNTQVNLGLTFSKFAKSKSQSQRSESQKPSVSTSTRLVLLPSWPYRAGTYGDLNYPVKIQYISLYKLNHNRDLKFRSVNES